MTNIKQFPNKKVSPKLPEELKNTEAYIMNEVMYCPTQLKTVTDFTTGDQRNRRWAMTVALAVVPSFDSMVPNTGPTLLPKSPTRFFTADSLEDLKARVVHEIDQAIALAKLSVEDPEEFIRQQTEVARNFSPVDSDDDMN